MWTPVLDAELEECVPMNAFDFEAVAGDLRDFCGANGQASVAVQITAEACRTRW